MQFLNDADERVRQRRQDAAELKEKEKSDAESAAFAKKHGLKTVDDFINYVKNEVLKSKGTGRILSVLAKEPTFKTNKKPAPSLTYGHGGKKKIKPHPLCPFCKGVCVPILDKLMSTHSKPIWKSQVKCTKCDKEHLPKEEN